jgi:hypothetical protein
MTTTSKELSKSQRRAIIKLPCDGVPRFHVKRAMIAVKVCYSAAFEDIFEMEGGVFEEGLAPDAPKRRIWTQHGIRRILRLNEQYWPFARKVIEAQRAAADLVKGKP